MPTMLVMLQFRGDYAYVDADEDGDVWPLCRLRYTGTIDVGIHQG